MCSSIFGWLAKCIIFHHCQLRRTDCICVSNPDSIRLLDVSALSTNSGLDLTMVLEYIDQDLSTFLSAVPASGLGRHKIKVRTGCITSTQDFFDVCLKDILIFERFSQKLASMQKKVFLHFKPRMF